jgi:methyl-accepting chemotaxis protein
VLALVLVAGACGDDDGDVDDATCDNVDDVREAFTDLEEVDVSEGELDELRSAVGDLVDEVDALVEGAQGELDDEIDAVASSVDELVSAVGEVDDDAALGDVAADIRTSVRGVGASVEDLREAAADVC